MHRRLLAALAAGSLLFAACGDDDSGGNNEYAEALAESMAQDEDLPFDQENVDCLSTEFVDALGGADALEEAGVSPEELRDSDDLRSLGLELGEDEAEAIASSFGTCDVSLANLVLAEAGEDVPEDVRGCVEESLDEDVLADFFASVLVDEDAGAEEPPPALLEPLGACF